MALLYYKAREIARHWLCSCRSSAPVHVIATCFSNIHLHIIFVPGDPFPLYFWSEFCI